MIKKIFGTLQIFPPASLRDSRDRTDLGWHAAARIFAPLAHKKMAGKIPATFVSKPIVERYA